MFTKLCGTLIGSVLVLGLLLFVTGPAQADSVSFTVGGWSDQFPGDTAPPAGAPWGVDGYPGDTVTFEGYTNTLDLTPGTYTLKINTLKWDIDYTWGDGDNPNAGEAEWEDLDHDFTANRSISFDGGSSGSLSQDGLLENTWYNDYLGLDAGSTVTFLVSGCQVDVRPLGLDEVGGSDFSNGPPWSQPDRNVMAEFTVSVAPVPVPAAVWGGMVLLGGMGGVAGLKRKLRRN